jgi:hypothetical protein
MTGEIWVRSSLRNLCHRLTDIGQPVSPPTVGRMLKGLGYSLRVNAKKIEAASNHPERNQQFEYIAVQGATFSAAQLPILSIDTKKKELVGNFKNTGQAWVCEPTAVNVHDFPGDALGRAVPYGVYDLTNNRGFIYLGSSGDTPAFAADAIATWWQTDGRATWPGRQHLLPLADAGGHDRAYQPPVLRITSRANSLSSQSATFPPAPARMSPGIRKASHSVAAPIRNDSQVTSGSSLTTATSSMPPSFSAMTWTNWVKTAPVNCRFQV